MLPLSKFAFAAACVLSAGLALAAAPPLLDAEPAAQWTRAGDRVVDTRSGLQWRARDNGADIDWNRARVFCTTIGAGWRLPSPEELRALYAGPPAMGTPVPCGASRCRIRAPIALSGAWFWSAAAVGKDAYDGDELAWGLSLANGARTQSVKEQAYGSRALCVRDGAAR